MPLWPPFCPRRDVGGWEQHVQGFLVKCTMVGAEVALAAWARLFLAEMAGSGCRGVRVGGVEVRAACGPGVLTGP